MRPAPDPVPSIELAGGMALWECHRCGALIRRRTDPDDASMSALATHLLWHDQLEQLHAEAVRR